MSYALKTEEVREAYQSTGDGLDFKRRWLERGEEFDAWLRDHDDDVRRDCSE